MTWLYAYALVSGLVGLVAAGVTWVTGWGVRVKTRVTISLLVGVVLTVFWPILLGVYLVGLFRN